MQFEQAFVIGVERRSSQCKPKATDPREQNI
jgi:hypothetical protein